MLQGKNALHKVNYSLRQARQHLEAEKQVNLIWYGQWTGKYMSLHGHRRQFSIKIFCVAAEKRNKEIMLHCNITVIS